jgi:hypothetical protein
VSSKENRLSEQPWHQRQADHVAALDLLWEIGSHQIIATKEANEIGEPFDIAFKTVEYKRTDDPKGPIADFNGVSTFAIATRIADKLGLVHRREFFGRGSQFRHDVTLARMAVIEDGTAPLPRTPRTRIMSDERADK